MGKVITVALIGAGSRGGTYAEFMKSEPDKFKIVSVCDPNKERLDYISDLFNLPAKDRFINEEEFFSQKRAELLVIATPDKTHVKYCLKGFALGYNLLTEKPLTDSRKECKKLLAAQKKSGKLAFVCHVLRYAPAFTKTKELLDKGVIGRIIDINATEQIWYWHTAHAYVRGNWGKRCESAPTILAKCCHDLDLLQYYVNSKCKTVSSVGDLTYFKRSEAPEGSADRCVDCKYVETCPYSAKRVYIDAWFKAGKPENIWPYNVIAMPPATLEKLENGIKVGPYGRCAYKCDNDMVDDEITQMVFENGVVANLTMSGFTRNPGRIYIFHGTLGELELNEEANEIYVKRFGEETEIVDVGELIEKGFSHGGGDYIMIKDLYDMLTGNIKAETSLERSIESHLMGIAAEESRLKGGKLVKVHK